MIYDVSGRIARITLNRPERGNGITLDLPRELAECVERADLDPNVHVIALSGNGTGFCGGYDLVASAEKMLDRLEPGLGRGSAPKGSALDPVVSGRNHDPSQVWVFLFAVLVVLGLITSLFIPRRRVWIKAVPKNGGWAIEYAALARGDDPALEAAVTELAEKHAALIGLRLKP